MCATCVRQPVKVKRKAITYFTERGIGNGKWFAFPKPEDERPPRLARKLKNNEKHLWCPWCADFTIYKKGRSDANYNCTGWCGWGNTGEFYVNKYNDLWFDDVPTADLKKVTMPAPAKPRGGKKRRG